MRYYVGEELKKRERERELRDAFQKGRLLPLKGKAVGIFEDAVANKNAIILDAGTGAGYFLLELNKLGYKNIYGLDIGNYLTEEAQSSIQGFKTADLNFDKLPWADGFFDAITAWEVFEHLENPHQPIREIYRILKPGGLLLMSVPNIFHIVSRLIFLKRGLFPRWNETNNHISVFPHGIFEKAFLKYFDLIKEGYVHSRIALPGLYRISKYFPENKWFGSWVYYILKKREKINEKWVGKSEGD